MKIRTTRKTFGRALGLALALAIVPSLANESPAPADGKPTVLITGSNRGIGLELARQYGARGWQVIATARKPADAKALQAIAAQYQNVTLDTLDLADHGTIDRLADKLAGRPVDILIHNAGISGGVPAQMLGRMDYQVFRDVLEVNVVGPMKLSEKLLPNLRASTQKKIVLIGTSEASFNRIDAGRLYWYRSSKAAAHMLMLNLAFELKGRQVAVGVINPGPVDTDLMKGVRMPLQPPAEAVGKVIGIIDRLSIENTGKFWDYAGGQLPW
jgi:NAD(P)-dependent dehydrogenase (short-subunit alcohol dehydrogenase family)